MRWGSDEQLGPDDLDDRPPTAAQKAVATLIVSVALATILIVLLGAR